MGESRCLPMDKMLEESIYHDKCIMIPVKKPPSHCDSVFEWASMTFFAPTWLQFYGSEVFLCLFCTEQLTIFQQYYHSVCLLQNICLQELCYQHIVDKFVSGKWQVKLG